jgi:hypothetical protein
MACGDEGEISEDVLKNMRKTGQEHFGGYSLVLKFHFYDDMILNSAIASPEYCLSSFLFILIWRNLLDISLKIPCLSVPSIFSPLFTSSYFHRNFFFDLFLTKGVY